MATFKFSDLITQYNNFAHATLKIEIDGTDIAENKNSLVVSDVEVINTCEYEASIASFIIYNSYSRMTKSFKYKETKKYASLGSAVVISLGYDLMVREVFRGFISNISYTVSQGVTGIVVTCMDVKGLMMAGNYSSQLQSLSYSEAVKEILKRTVYEKLQSAKVITSLDGIADTPDKAAASNEKDKANDRYIEMVAESDYEFVVKAAKKYNFEFFMLGGVVYFREAKSNKEILIELDADAGITSLDIEYDITGLAGSIEVRNMDVGSNNLYKEKKKLNNVDGKAKTLISSINKVYIDPTIRSKEDAKYRAAYLENDISYRYGTLRAEMVGLPEISPGYFINISIIEENKPVSFYVTEVRHVLNDDGFATYITGKAAKMGTI